MFAKTLEGVLLRLLQGADIAGPDATDLALRFDRLRGSGLLPTGRENRSRRLTSEQIANAILGLAAQRPTWAAVACGALARLQPIGGSAEQRLAEPSLRALVTRLINEECVRARLVALRLTVSETGVNSHGGAQVIFRDAEGQDATSYVPQLATSALHAGREAIDAERRFAPASRDLVLNARFFIDLARHLEESLRFATPEGDGTEYDTDDARRARMVNLQYGPNAHFLNLGVDTQTDWPREETLVVFDGVRLVLMPPTVSTTTSIHVDLVGNQITSEEAQTVIRRFLSVLTWRDDRHAVLGNGWSGNPVPVAVARAEPGFSTAVHWFGPRRSPNNDKANRALAHYRAGCNAEHAGLVSYSVLSFYKVLEVHFRQDERMLRWVAQTLTALRRQPQHQKLFDRFDAARGEQSPESHIKDAYRLAVAHASTRTPSDEDSTMELRRLKTGADILRTLAQALIIDKLGIDALLRIPPP